DGVLDALAHPLEAGHGVPFRSFASGNAPAEEPVHEPPAVASRPPPPSAAKSGADANPEPTPQELSAEHAREAQVSTKGEEGRSNRGGFDDGSTGSAAGAASAPAPSAAKPGGPTPTQVAGAHDGPASMVKPAHPPTNLNLTIEYPNDGAMTSGPVGGFLSG